MATIEFNPFDHVTGPRADHRDLHSLTVDDELSTLDAHYYLQDQEREAEHRRLLEEAPGGVMGAVLSLSEFISRLRQR